MKIGIWVGNLSQGKRVNKIEKKTWKETKKAKWESEVENFLFQNFRCL